MARLERITPAGVPVYLIQRGNNRQVIFADESDFKAYLHWLQEYSEKFSVSIHAWCLMTNHVHLLCTGDADDSISKMMQSIGRQYVRYFNHKYQRTGTLWEGRFRSCLVDADSYLFELYRYIELNPVRASMVESPDEYPWSSYRINALGVESDLCTPHERYLALGNSGYERQKSYRDVFQILTSKPLIEDIRQSTNKGMAIGSEKFKTEIELLTGRRVHASKAGRPIGWRKDKNEV
ncbi:transposase [Thiomicrorhabdus sp. 6S3-12]|uniref:transposase n=1 Tax=Thiomicrorhabdus sp. 6S3-12 TaxID=2819681 RepID=UPI001AAD6BB3|nr:transposase [Thiomicrorhabdus sp. 6S3-12]MBO1924370.1 transposase [Thiomicrorhabdus sp. 6S3-12]